MRMLTYWKEARECLGCRVGCMQCTHVKNEHELLRMRMLTCKEEDRECLGCSVGCMVAPSHCSNMVFCVALRRESIMALCSPAVKESVDQQTDMMV